MLTRRFSLLRWAGLLLLPSMWASDFPEPFNTEPGDPQPMPAEEAARSMKLPAGFRCEVFASEPQVQQPIAMCFDQRGRLWVAECYTYAEQPLRWNLELRDRILILEDTDGDGRADSRTVFWDEGKRLTSIAVTEGGVWALCAPHLLFLPDADGDDVPDAEPTVVLDGFEAETIGHNIVNGLKQGPDGWLYGRHGITSTSAVGTPETSREDRLRLNCSIWRYHPIRQQFELFCNGGTNPWGMDWDANGQLFYTNTVIGHLWHAIPGAYYRRMFGTHLNPRVYEVIPHTADHYHWDTGTEKWNDIRKGITDSTSLLGGGHAHMGCLIYQGGTWPEAFHGKLFTCNLHGNRINMDILEREGCGYVARHGKDFMIAADTWFRGLDLLTGPDGNVWVNDWSDTGECHDNSGIHRTSGRIYRIVYEGPDKGQPQTARPDWLTKRAQDAYGREALTMLLDSPYEERRAMAVRWMAEDFGRESNTLKQFVRLAGSDPSGLVRLELAAALQRLPLRSRFALAVVLANQPQDVTDRQQSLLIWYGLEPAVSSHPELTLGLISTARMPKLRQHLSRRLTEDLDQNPRHLDQLVTLARQSSPETQTDVLQGMAAALQGWSQARKPSQWDLLVASVEQRGQENDRNLVRELSILFGSGRARDELLAIAQDSDADATARRSALTHLLRQPSPDLLPLLKKGAGDRILASVSIRGLAQFEDPAVPKLLLNQWKRRAANRSAVVDTLVSRPSYAEALLAAVHSGTLPRDAISPFQARQIRSLGSSELKQSLREVWGEIRESTASRQKELATWKAHLSPEVLSAADPTRGRTVFQNACAACHKLYGEGGALGPDLTGSDRKNLDYLLENTLDPNAVVPADYQMTLFKLQDGRVVTGVIPEENAHTVTVQTPAERLVLERKQITSREKMPASLMPEGLLQALEKSAVEDLIAYLMSTRQVEAR